MWEALAAGAAFVVLGRLASRFGEAAADVSREEDSDRGSALIIPAVDALLTAVAQAFVVFHLLARG